MVSERKSLTTKLRALFIFRLQRRFAKIYPSENTQLVFTCSNSTLETPERYVKFVHS